MAENKAQDKDSWTITGEDKKGNATEVVVKAGSLGAAIAAAAEKGVTALSAVKGDSGKPEEE